jgi:hypothetical protein
VHPRVVRAGGGVPGFPLEVAEPGPDRLPDHLVDFADQARPVLVTFSVAGLAGQSGVLTERGMEDRDRLGQRNGQVEEQRALPGLLGRLDPQLVLAVGGGVRLGGHQLRVQVGGFAAAVVGLAQQGAVGGFALPEQQVMRLALDRLARLNARLRRAVNARGHFPAGQAAMKCLHLAIMSLDPTGPGRQRRTNRWKAALNASDITFDGRLSAGRK